MGETSRGLKTRINEHRRDLQYDLDTNALVQHRQKTNHRVRPDKEEILEKCKNKKNRKITESLYISKLNNFNTMKSSYPVAKLLTCGIG